MAADKKWGVTQVIVRYVSGDDTWEVTLDPKNVDILVFNWERFKKVNEVVGSPISPRNHVKPDGKIDDGDDPAEVAKRIGLSGPPKKVGKRESGTGDDPICIHNQNCTWWCLDETHSHDNPPPPDD